MGDSFHPGGLALTRCLGELLLLNHADRVLDIAAGKGISALFLAETFGCEVVGVVYGRYTTPSTNETARAAGLADRVLFETGDAENLPFADATFTAVICECAFCTFPNKKQDAAEMARVLNELVKSLRGRLLAAELMMKLGKIDWPKVDFAAA